MKIQITVRTGNTEPYIARLVGSHITASSTMSPCAAAERVALKCYTGLKDVSRLSIDKYRIDFREVTPRWFTAEWYQSPPQEAK